MEHGKNCYCDACTKYLKSMFKKYLVFIQNVKFEAVEFIKIADQKRFEESWEPKARKVAYLAQETLVKVFRPRHLKELGLERVEELKMVYSEEDLPATLRRELEEWPVTRQDVLRENVLIIAEAEKKIRECCAEN